VETSNEVLYFVGYNYNVPNSFRACEVQSNITDTAVHTATKQEATIVVDRMNRQHLWNNILGSEAREDQHAIPN